VQTSDRIYLEFSSRDWWRNLHRAHWPFFSKFPPMFSRSIGWGNSGSIVSVVTSTAVFFGTYTTVRQNGARGSANCSRDNAYYCFLEVTLVFNCGENQVQW